MTLPGQAYAHPAANATLRVPSFARALRIENDGGRTVAERA